MNNHSNIPSNPSSVYFREVSEIASIVAFILGMALIASAILLGRSYAFYISFLVVSIIMTLLWKKAPRPWISLASISASTPIAVFRQQFACNIIFAFCFTVFNINLLLKIPKWIYVAFVMGLIGFATSAFHWMSGDFVQSIMRQGAFACNFLLGPLILLPMIYVRMRHSQNYVANLQGLLFGLIIPSTLLLIAAKLFGTVTNSWEASLHAGSLAEGYLEYSLGKVIIDFSRTGVGFILAALICASTAITISQIKGLYRFLAGACLVSNIYLLLATGSFGSIFACFCGLAAMFYRQLRNIRMTKALVSMCLICFMLLLVYGLSPHSTKEYLGKRFEHRVVNADTDRFTLWARAIDHFLQYPGGVGLTYVVGDKVKSNPHNEFIVYFVSYGAIGGLSYLFLVTGLLIYFLKGRKRKTNDQYEFAVYLAGLSVTVAFAINSMTDNVGVIRWYFNLIWSLIWYCYFCSHAGQSVINRENIMSQVAVAGATTPRMK